jgi:hypothetical protein
MKFANNSCRTRSKFEKLGFNDLMEKNSFVEPTDKEINEIRLSEGQIILKIIKK